MAAFNARLKYNVGQPTNQVNSEQYLSGVRSNRGMAGTILQCTSLYIIMIISRADPIWLPG